MRDGRITNKGSYDMVRMVSQAKLKITEGDSDGQYGINRTQSPVRNEGEMKMRRSREKSSGIPEGLKELTNNASFAAVLPGMIKIAVKMLIPGALGVFGTYTVCQKVIIADNYVRSENISSFIETSLVKTGYVDASVLELDSYPEQMEMIREAFEEYSNVIETSLSNLGISQTAISVMSQSERMDVLELKTGDVYASYNQISDELAAVQETSQQLQGELDTRMDAKILDSILIIDGETMNEGVPIPNAAAVIEGNYYYSRSLLDAYILDDNLVYKSDSDNIVYGYEKPERVELSWNDMVTNPSSVEYKGLDSEPIKMSTMSYEKGIVMCDGDAIFYIHPLGEYSKLTFTCGHVDGSEQNAATLSFYQISGDGLSYDKVLATIPLTGEMSPKEYSVDLNYTDAVKVVQSGDGWTRYAMTDIYLCR